MKDGAKCGEALVETGEDGSMNCSFSITDPSVLKEIKSSYTKNCSFGYSYTTDEFSKTEGKINHISLLDPPARKTNDCH